MNPRSSLILQTVLDGVYRTAFVFSLFLLFAGHNAPGGGFVAGLVAATALVLRYVAADAPRTDPIVRVAPSMFLGGGLFVAALTGFGGWVWGEQFLESAKVEFALPVLGTLKATSALPFDIGVYLVVIGLGLTVLRSLAAEATR